MNKKFFNLQAQKAMPNSYKKVMERIQSPKSEMEQLLN